MTTTTPTYTYRAQTDAGTKHWHLGAAETGAKCVCGTRLMTPDDTRAFALKLAADKRRYDTSDDLTLVSCGACMRGSAWKEAATATGEAKPPTRKRPSAATRAAAKNAAKTGGLKANNPPNVRLTGGTVIEADPETGLPRIKPEIQAKADQIVADQLAAKRAAKDAG